jgi:hypothetical protein
MKKLNALAVMVLLGASFYSAFLISPEQKAMTQTPRNPAQNSKDYDYDYADRDDDTNQRLKLSFEELLKILEQKRFSKIEDLLSYLSKTKPDYMSRYVLGYASKSLHESSLQYPRAIVYGRDATMILSFNGESHQRAYEMLEVARYNKQNLQYEFYEIEFNEKGQLGSQPYKISPEGGPAPDHICLRCHLNHQPLWHSYSVWPGFYGVEDDFPIYSGDGNGKGTFGLLGLATKGNEKVIKEWLNFKNNGLTTGRYRFLKEKRATSPDGDGQARPNTDFTNLLYHQNKYRINELLRQAGAGEHEPLRSLVIYGLECQKSNESFVNDKEVGIAARKISANAKKFSEETKQRTRNYIMRDLLELVTHYNLQWKDIEYHIDHKPEELEDSGPPWPPEKPANAEQF